MGLHRNCVRRERKAEAWKSQWGTKELAEEEILTEFTENAITMEDAR